METTAQEKAAAEAAAAAAAQAAENEKILFELKMSRRWKEDISNAQRSLVSDILSHIEGKLPELVGAIVRPIVDEARSAASRARNDNTEAIGKHQARVTESIRDAQKQLENKITIAVLATLKEYQVLGEDGNLNPHSVAYALTKISKA